MRFMLRFLLFSLLFVNAFVLSANPSFSKKDRKVWRQAEEHFTYSEYDEALPLFLRLIEKDPENSQLNYKLGICYYFSTTSRPLCVPYYERALAHAGRDTTSDLLYHAGVGFLIVNHFEQAHDLFLRLNKRREGMNYTELKHLIQCSENGMAAWKNPARIRIRNLGRNINSPYPDYAPVITPDQSMLLFTSKRKGTTGGRRDDDGYYYEDVYQSRNLASKRWGASDRYDTNYRAPHFGPFSLFFARAENVTQINTNDHDGSISLAPDGKKLFIYRYSDIWEADWAESGWKKPKRMGKTIDARASHEPSVCISPDGKTLFFVSDRKGSMGGKDIWYCSRAADNSWEKPRNLGRNFNTEYNEDAPCLTADGNTLYFASEGHNSMGGYDIFKSKKMADGTWSPAENLGAPINNGGDDIFYVPNATDDGGYYASLNRFGEGDLDLYSVMKYPDVTPTVKLRVNSDLAQGKNIRLRLRDLQTGKDTSMTLQAKDSIMYAYAPGSRHALTVEADGYMTVRDTLSFFRNNPYEYCLQDLMLTKYADATQRSYQKFELTNYFFDIDYAVDADTLLDLMTNRLEARQLFLNKLSSIDNLYTAWASNEIRQERPDAITSIASNSVRPVEGEGLELNKNLESVNFSPVLFDYDESIIREDMQDVLNGVVAWMQKHPEAKIEVRGYADSKGSEAYNRQLSQKRALAVQRYLVIHGITNNRIRVYGSGENDPVAPNTSGDADNPEGRSLNRRAEVRVVK